MLKTAFATGNEIYAAAVEGAKRGYNRSTDNYAAYEDAISDVYEYYLSTATRSTRRAIEHKTKGDWRNAYLPLMLMMEHKHIGGKPSETHARVMLQGKGVTFIDIPLDRWEQFESQTKELLAN